MARAYDITYISYGVEGGRATRCLLVCTASNEERLIISQGVTLCGNKSKKNGDSNMITITLVCYFSVSIATNFSYSTCMPDFSNFGQFSFQL